MAVYANISIDQGSTFSSTITVEGSDGLIFNLSGYTVRGQIRKNYSSTSFTAFTATVLSAVNGTITVSLTAQQTLALAAGRYRYDVEVVQTSTGNVTRVVEGQVEISAGVTKP